MCFLLFLSLIFHTEIKIFCLFYIQCKAVRLRNFDFEARKIEEGNKRI